ncbi:MAG: RnfABCDGE type electron transport complex subunit D, partial [Clostridia bacterium]|nr:RnfABCDGE type electron transport complex subunit D [Clostridia bacterium]
WNLILKKPQSIGDLSAIVTGLLLGMNLPATTPLWIAAIGSIAAIIVVKQMFGGLGYNFANPAITARIILLVSFSSKVTSFVEPISHTTSGATPLAMESGSVSIRNLFFGMHSGCIGETSAFLLLIGGLVLVLRRVIKPIIPLSFLGTFALCSLIAGDNVLEQLLMGGLILGAVFMATDYVTCPVTDIGKLIFGIGCGALTFIIRHFGNLPEGVSYAILLMNILVPHINTLTLKKPFGMKEGKANG